LCGGFAQFIINFGTNKTGKDYMAATTLRKRLIRRAAHARYWFEVLALYPFSRRRREWVKWFRLYYGPLSWDLFRYALIMSWYWQRNPYMPAQKDARVRAAMVKKLENP
jgi:hypothetical protein